MRDTMPRVAKSVGLELPSTGGTSFVAVESPLKEKVCDWRWDPTAKASTLHPPTSLFDYEQMTAMEDLFLLPAGDHRSVCSEIIDTKNSVMAIDRRSVISEAKLHHRSVS
ncbi:hypothetical protein STAS_25030 [Striga asiatica]|uniref:Uncharacterized protein n=1 Tax=Striga asiatica TaxID=4170 RepID=A0A5A7QRA2_STRAF|nr:hypothetical protein STAS_25030 [Striga asiatica]